MTLKPDALYLRRRLRAPQLAAPTYCKPNCRCHDYDAQTARLVEMQKRGAVLGISRPERPICGRRAR